MHSGRAPLPLPEGVPTGDGQCPRGDHAWQIPCSFACGMPLDQNPIGSLQRSLRSVLRRLGDPRLVVPFVLLALLKVTLLLAVARLDLFPAHLVAAALWAFPPAVEFLHYPETVYRLPELARWMDRFLFLTLGALLHGWAIVYLARTWTRTRLRLLPGLGSGFVRLVSLFLIALVVLSVPFAAQFVARHLTGAFATTTALVAGAIVQMCLFTAPAFLVIEGRSLWRSIRLSFAALGEYPMAIPCAVFLLALVHLPAFLLRLPLFFAGSRQDPDWILRVALLQLPFDLLGAILAAGLTARFALGFRSGRGRG